MGRRKEETKEYLTVNINTVYHTYYVLIIVLAVLYVSYLTPQPQKESIIPYFRILRLRGIM